MFVAIGVDEMYFGFTNGAAIASAKSLETFENLHCSNVIELSTKIRRPNKVTNGFDFDGAARMLAN